MPVKQIIEEFERRKRDGDYDELIFNQINLTVKFSDREIEEIDIESTARRAKELFNVQLFKDLKRLYPDLF